MTVNFCEISQIDTHRLFKRKKPKRQFCPMHELVCYFTVTIKIHTYISISKARYIVGKLRKYVLEKTASLFHMIILLPRDGTKRLKISAFLRFPSEQTFQGIAQEMSSLFDFQFC